METKLRRQSTRCDIVRTAEGREEVIKRVFVGDVHTRETKTPLVLIAVEQIILPNRSVKQAAFSNARRVLIVILRTGRRNRHQVRSELRSQALITRYSDKRSSLHTVASQPSLKLLIRRQTTQINPRLSVDRDGRSTVRRIAQTVRIGHVVARH